MAKSFYNINSRKAKEIAELAFTLIRKEYEDIRIDALFEQHEALLALAAVSKVFIKISSSKRAPEIVDYTFEKVKKFSYGKSYNLLSVNIVKALAELNLETTIQISEPLIKQALLGEVPEPFVFFAKAFIKKSPERTFDLIKDTFNILHSIKFVSYENNRLFTVLMSLCKLLTLFR